LICCNIVLQGQITQRCESTNLNSEANTNSQYSYPRNGIEIPIVFHIVWNRPGQNIPDEYIFSQLEVLNDDYNAENEDLLDLPSEFKKVQGNPGISFCLANMDPRGTPTNGIIRTNTSWTNIGGQRLVVDGKRRIKNTSLGGSDPWDTKKYLNIWIGARGDGLLGDATFPNEEDPNKIDGIVVSPEAIGKRPDLDSPFNRGRTLTHEIGHYLNLNHLSGTETGCFTDDDDVEDTPNQFEEYFGTCDEPVESCDSRDMDMNFMSFRDDACLLFFTKGQVARMTETLFSERFELISSNTCSESNPLAPDPLKIAKIFTLSDQIEVSLVTLVNREYDLELYDVLGRYHSKVENNPAHTYRFRYENYPSGIYILKLVVEGKQFLRKVYIN